MASSVEFFIVIIKIENGIIFYFEDLFFSDGG